LDGLLNTTYELFFPEQYGGKIMSEVACEPNQSCNRNQLCFKAFLSTWMAFVTSIASHTANEIIPRLKASALGAAQQCSGGQDNTHCGRRWYQDTWDGYKGLEEQMSALGILSAQMITLNKEEPPQPPLTSNTGGTSESNPNAGIGEEEEEEESGSDDLSTITTRDRAGAGVATAVFVCGWIGTVTFTLWGG
jgi:mannan endo-1,6-alpha-mannosidase